MQWPEAREAYFNVLLFFFFFYGPGVQVVVYVSQCRFSCDLARFSCHKFAFFQVWPPGRAGLTKSVTTDKYHDYLYPSSLRMFLSFCSLYY